MSDTLYKPGLSPHEQQNDVIKGDYNEVIGRQFSRRSDETIYLDDGLFRKRSY